MDDMTSRGEGRGMTGPSTPPPCCTAWATTTRPSPPPSWHAVRRHQRPGMVARGAGRGGRARRSPRARARRSPAAFQRPLAQQIPTGHFARERALACPVGRVRPPRTAIARRSSGSAVPACARPWPAPTSCTANGCAARTGVRTPAPSCGPPIACSPRWASRRSPSGPA